MTEIHIISYMFCNWHLYYILILLYQLINQRQESTRTEAVHLDIFRVCRLFLFCSGAKLTIKKEKEKERKEPKERINKENRNKYIFFIFIYYIYLYIIYLGGAERGESTGNRKHYRSIWKRYTALFVHVLRGERNRGYEKRKSICLEWCTPLHPPPCI